MIFVLSLLLLFGVAYTVANSSYTREDFASGFGDAFKVFKMVLKKCWHKAISERDKSDVNFGLQLCLKRVSLVALDKATQEEIIHLPFGINLVKITEKINETTSLSGNSKLLSPDDWKSAMIEKVFTILRSHALRLPSFYAMGVATPHEESFEVGRRRRKKMEDNILVFGVMAMLIIAIPLGFQFLAVLGGKALLLAKMALILTSIQGLKKIATSDVGYGLYHNARRPWSYDRKWQNPLLDYQGNDAGGYDAMEQELDPFYPLKPRISSYSAK